jgi:hypothetical protein
MKTIKLYAHNGLVMCRACLREADRTSRTAEDNEADWEQAEPHRVYASNGRLVYEQPRYAGDFYEPVGVGLQCPWACDTCMSEVEK